MAWSEVLPKSMRLVTESRWSVRGGRLFSWYTGDVEASIGTAVLLVGIARSLRGVSLTVDSSSGLLDLIGLLALSLLLASAMVVFIRIKLIAGEGLWMHAPAPLRQGVDFAAPALLVFAGIGLYAANVGGEWGLLTASGSVVAVLFALAWARFGRPRHLMMAGAVQVSSALFGSAGYAGAAEDALMIVASVVTISGSITLARARARGTRGPVLPAIVGALASEDRAMRYLGLRAARTMVDAGSIGRLLRLAYEDHPVISSLAVDVLWVLWGDSQFITMPRYIRHRAAGPWRIDPQGAPEPESSAFRAYQNHLDRVEFALRAAAEHDDVLVDLICAHAVDLSGPSGDRRLRLLSIRVLGALHTVRATNLVAAIACTDSDRDARSVAMVSAQSAEPDIALELLRYLTDEPVWVSRQAFRVLGAIASRAMDHNRSQFEHLRFACMVRTRELLDARSPVVRAFAVALSAQIDEEVTDRLPLFLADESAFVRCHALHALYHLKGECARELLVRSLGDPRACVRRVGIEGLLYLRHEAGIPPLLRMHDDPVPSVAAHAAHAVSVLELYRDDV